MKPIPKCWHVWDFPNCVYIKFTDSFRIKIYNKLKAQYKTIRGIGRVLNCDPSKIRGFFKHNKPSCFISITAVKNIIRMYPEIKNKLEKSIVAYRSSNKSIVENPVLPIKESPELYNVIVHLLGDGSFRFYSNTCKELITEFKNNLKIFGYVKTNEYVSDNGVTIVTIPSIISHVIENVFDIKIVRPNRLPKALFTTSRECKISAVRAIFDDEGCVKKPQRFSLISISLSSLSFLRNVKTLVGDLNIKTGIIFESRKGQYIFNVSAKSYEAFLNEIGFTHPKKMERLKKTVEYKNRFKNIRKRIIQLVEENPRSRFEIAKETGHSLGSTTVFMYQLRKHGIVKSSFVGKNKNYVWTRA